MAQQIYDKTCKELLAIAANQLIKDVPDGFSIKQIYQWFENNYPKFKKNSVSAHIRAATTNDSNRIHHRYLKNDLLFREEDRTYRLYIEGSDPAPITPADGDKVDRQKLPPTSAFTKQLLLDALHKLDAGYDHNFGKSNTYDVVHNGKRYPPKAVVGIAAQDITGIPFVPDDFNGGAATRCMKILKSHGIYWEKKQLFEPTFSRDELDDAVEKILTQEIPLGEPPIGNKIPNKRKPATSTEEIERDPNVKAWVLRKASQKCELCNKPAPFKSKKRGNPGYLEVHHVVPLKPNGPDTICNAVALCPNCHMRCHHSVDADVATAKLYEQVERLIRP